MVSVVVPAFNEENAIAQTVEEIAKTLTSANIGEFEIIVVDDGSSDKTAEIATNAGARVVSKCQNVGYGHSLKLGITAAKFDTIVITDADGTYPIETIPDLLAEYNKGFNMVVGARTGRHYHESLLKSPLRLILTGLVQFTVGARVPDVNSGLRVFSRKQIMSYFENLSDSFSFTTSSTLIYFLEKKYLKYIPIAYHQRIGKTKVKLFWDSLRTLQYIVNVIMAYNPLKLFIILFLIASLTGIGFVAGGLISNTPSLTFFGGQSLLISMLVLAMGLMSDLIRQHYQHMRKSSKIDEASNE